MVQVNPPWKGPPVALKRKRGWVTIDNETSAEEFAREVDTHIDGVWIKQLTSGRHGWEGPCLYVVANEPITKEKFRRWWDEESGGEAEEDYGPNGIFEFEKTLEVQ